MKLIQNLVYCFFGVFAILSQLNAVMTHDASLASQEAPAETAKALEEMKEFKGEPYVWGENDCSGVVSKALHEADPKFTERLTTKQIKDDIDKPENARYIRESCNATVAGDLIWWPPLKEGSEVGHTGMVSDRPPAYIAANGGKSENGGSHGQVEEKPDLNTRDGAICFDSALYLKRDG